jgi:nucleoid DNA-binding protein
VAEVSGNPEISGKNANVLFYPPGFSAKLCPVHGNPLTQPSTQEHYMANNKPGKKPTTKSEIYAHIAEKTSLKRKDVVAVFDTLTSLIERDLKKGPGIFNLVGMMKIKMVYKPAVAARKGINPFTKEEVIFKAKPARNVVKCQPLKMLKDMV